jgi:hypothetical protein
MGMSQRRGEAPRAFEKYSVNNQSVFFIFFMASEPFLIQEQAKRTQE